MRLPIYLLFGTIGVLLLVGCDRSRSNIIGLGSISCCGHRGRGGQVASAGKVGHSSGRSHEA